MAFWETIIIPIYSAGIRFGSDRKQTTNPPTPPPQKN